MNDVQTQDEFQANELTASNNNLNPSTSNSLAMGVFATAESFSHAWRVGKMLASSELIPKDFQGKTADCCLAVDMAQRLGASPLAVLQNIYIVHGKPSWSSTFLIAMINACGRFETLQFRKTGTGDDRECVAWTKSKATGEVIEGPPVSILMAKKEGWFSKNGSKWQTIPELMLNYRAATFFARLYVPDLTLGIRPIDEIEDMAEQDYRKLRDAAKRKPFIRVEEKTEAVEIETEQEELPELDGKTINNLIEKAYGDNLTIKELHERARLLEKMGADEEELSEDAAKYLLDNYEETKLWILNQRKKGGKQ